MNKQHEQYSYFDGHRGTHVGDGVYKIDEPYVSEVLEVMITPSTKSFSVLYKWIDYDADIIEVWYFRENCDGNFKLRKELMLNKYDGDDLHYLEVRNNNEIGGVCK